MRFRQNSLALVLVATFGLVLGLSQPKTANGQILKQLGLRSGELITIDRPSKSELGITINGKDYMVDFTLFSNRSTNFRLMVPSETGELVEVAAPPVNTIRGTLRGMAGSCVVGCITEQGCCAKIRLPSGKECFMEPVSRTLENPAFDGMHVVYTNRDVIETQTGCGTLSEAIEVAENAVTETAGPLQVADIAVEADFDFYLAFGSSTSATLSQMELLINIANEQYESQAGIRHLVSDTIIRTTRSSNPWATNDSSALVRQLRDFYVSGDGAGTISGDLCHLFTGRVLLDNVGGIAFLGVVCNPESAFGITTINSPLSIVSNILAHELAHELGHNWNLQHCDCPAFTMNPFITGSDSFSAASITALTDYRDTLTCLDTLGVGFGLAGDIVNRNDEVTNRIRIPDLDFTSIRGSNVNATTQPNEQDLINTGSTT